jgi:hypothetical protein
MLHSEISSMTNVARVAAWENDRDVYVAVVTYGGWCFVANRDKIVKSPWPVSDCIIYCDEKCVFLSIHRDDELVQVVLSLELEIVTVHTYERYGIGRLLTSLVDDDYNTVYEGKELPALYRKAPLTGGTVGVLRDPAQRRIDIALSAFEDTAIPRCAHAKRMFLLEEGTLWLQLPSRTTALCNNVLYLRRELGPLLCFVKKYE